MTGVRQRDLEARRLVREEGYGREELMVKLGLSEREARTFVFGKAAAMRWWRREKREREAS